MGQGYRINAKAGDAEVFIYEDVGAGWFGGVSAKQFADDLKALGRVGAINLRLNSYGGDVFDGLAIYRQLVDHPARVVTHVDGVAASIASVIAMAGDEIRISEAGFLMIHNAWGMALGPADDMRRMADVLDMTTGAIAEVYAARSNSRLTDIRKWMDEESWFTAVDAVEHGLADTIIANQRVAAALQPDRHKFKRLPAALAGTATPSRPNYSASASRLAMMRAALAQRKITQLRTT